MDIQFRAYFLPEKKMYPRAFQKWFHVLLCDEKAGKPVPVRRAKYDDCVLFQNTTLEDKNGRSVFEGDRVRIKTQRGIIEDIVGEVPDMMKSRHLHPLYTLLVKHHLLDQENNLDIEVIGHLYS